MREWALLNPEPKRRNKMLEFLDKTYVCAMAYSGDAVNADQFSRYARRCHRQPSLMELMKMHSGSDSTFDNLKRVQSMGFGKVYIGGDFSGGIVSVVPLVSEASLAQTGNICFDAGFGTFLEHMEWMHMNVSVKKVKHAAEPEEGIDNIISEAEYLGKLRHPNIVLLMGICQSVSLENMWLIFEFFEQATLHHFLHYSMPEFQRTLSPLYLMNKSCNHFEVTSSSSESSSLPSSSSKGDAGGSMCQKYWTDNNASLRNSLSGVPISLVKICIDKALCPWRGHSSFRVYMKDKPTKWGIKLYILSESQTGYAFNFKVHCNALGVSNTPFDICNSLLLPLVSLVHTLYVDNYYCCPKLADKLVAGTPMLLTLSGPIIWECLKILLKLSLLSETWNISDATKL
ncbi:PiggyBac transposable element-derived protein 4-like [Plakobranchus ocellatus]|uniref:PiggyBac transposable element-derived protein 4-like n=1 Tax=Plakobranchus ocellatus TaxID=259542 RepID=A0AAV3Y742_9GAST|nr:PiggyBac transposable element-derived protein 4-like [Plakobranchus ocellatus]